MIKEENVNGNGGDSDSVLSTAETYYFTFPTDENTYEAEVLSDLEEKEGELFPLPPAIEPAWEMADDPEAYNTGFQKLLELSDEPHEKKYMALSQLAGAFIADATSLGRIIIIEQHLPESQRFIKPLKLRGLAGGYKYVAHSILFKFCKDIPLNPGYWMYGYKRENNDYAITACGRELIALNTMVSCNIPELHFPLMAAIDYRGYRLLAISLLPISRETLQYGSDDGCKTVHNSNVDVEKLMKRVGSILNLREHYVGRDKKLLVPCGDIEVHLSKKDNRYYVLDFQRLLPPEKPERNQSVFYNFLRPEFVKKYSVSLCSDAYTGFLSSEDPNRDEMMEDIDTATKILYEEVIDKFVQEIIINESYLGEKIVLYDDFSLVYEIHQRGINLRHLGRIRSKLISLKSTSQLDTYLLQEMCLRSLKVYFRRSCREVISISNEPIKATLAELLNIISLSSKYRDFWTIHIKKMIELKYGKMALQGVTLPLHLDKFKLITRLSQLCGFRIKATTLKEFKKYEKSDRFEFKNLDIEDIFPVVKYMSYLDYVSGVKELEGFHLSTYDTAYRLEKLQLETACDKFRNSLFRNPSDLAARFKSAEAKLELLKRIWEETPLKLELDELISAITEWHTLHPNDDKAKLLLVEAHTVRSLFWSQPIPESINPFLLISSIQNKKLLNDWVIRNFWTLWKVPPLIFTEIHKLLLTMLPLLLSSGIYSARIINEILLSPGKITNYIKDNDIIPNINVFIKELYQSSQPELDIFSSNPNSDFLSSISQILEVLLFQSPHFTTRPRSWRVKRLYWEWKSSRQWIPYDEISTFQLEESYQRKEREHELPHKEGMNPFYARRGYLVNFERWVQINQITMFERPVRREWKVDVLAFPQWVYCVYYLYNFCLRYMPEVDFMIKLTDVVREQGLLS